MAIGGRVRKLFGRHEGRVAALWRSMFVDLDQWTETISEWAPEAKRVLELGCGEGYSTMKLAAACPRADIDAVDIGSHIGRLYRGPADRVRFRRITAEKLAEDSAGLYDLIVVSDVLHHIPGEARISFLNAARALLAPGGILAFKDWHRNSSPIYYLAYAADRWLTGDRIAYSTRDEARILLNMIFGSQSISEERTISPWSNNYAMKIVAQ